MDFNSKNLTKIINICRKKGISQFKCTEFEITLGHLPEKERIKKLPKEAQKNIQILDDLSPEDKLFWSAGPQEIGIPG